jgi:hypothetical protein
VELKAGTLDDFSNSMAAAMERAFDLVWNARWGTPLPTQTRDDRRLLFVAIAQGVIRHLKDNALQGFDVDVTVEQTATGPFISSTGSTTTGHSHTVSVSQGSAVGNRVQSDGEGTVSIVTTGQLYP